MRQKLESAQVLPDVGLFSARQLFEQIEIIYFDRLFPFDLLALTNFEVELDVEIG